MNKKTYQEKLVPLINEIKSICYKDSTPFFITVALDEEEKTVYESECLTSGVLEKKVTDDKIAKMINVINGFETVPTHEILEINF